jgi:hypothetical protein
MIAGSHFQRSDFWGLALRATDRVRLDAIKNNLAFAARATKDNFTSLASQSEAAELAAKSKVVCAANRTLFIHRPIIPRRAGRREGRRAILSRRTVLRTRVPEASA